MSDQGEKTCPLCAEEMDLTDQQLKPCKCGYEICVWCWHHIMDMAEKDESEGRCPACRSPYDKEKIVGTAGNCGRLVAEINCDRKMKSQKAKINKSSDGRKQLSSVRVIQRHLVYVVGLPINIADEDLLQKKEYFAQYGKVLKVSMSRTSAGVIQQFPNNTCSVYITYTKEEEAIRCIQSVHGFILDGRSLKACFGTTKYCHAWLRNVPCTNSDCLYLHEIGSQEDSFTKDEIISAYTRSRVQQVTGATYSLQRRSGDMLPPPWDDFYIDCSTASNEKPRVKNASNNLASISRVSPPNSSSGIATALPAGASWGLRATNGQSPVVTTAYSNEPSKQNTESDICSSPLAFSSSIASTSQVSTVHSGLENKLISTENAHIVQAIRKMNRSDSLKQHMSIDPQTISSDYQVTADRNPSNTDIPAPQDNDRGISVPPEITNYADVITQIDGGGISSEGKIQSLCSEISSISIDKPNERKQCCTEPEGKLLASAAYNKAITANSDTCLSSEHREWQLNSYSQDVEDELQYFDDQRLKDPEVVIKSSFMPSSDDSLHMSNHSREHSSCYNDSYRDANFNTDSLFRYSNINEGFPPHSYRASGVSNGYPENLVSSSTSFHRAAERPYLHGDATNVENDVAIDMGESSIISNILSMDFDMWDDPLTSPQSLAKLLAETDKKHGSINLSSSRKVQSSNQSKFSFARQEDSKTQQFGDHLSFNAGRVSQNCSSGPEFVDNRLPYFDNLGNGNHFSFNDTEKYTNISQSQSAIPSSKLSVSRPQISAPPGFSVPNRAPPPGFSSHERMDQTFDKNFDGPSHNNYSLSRSSYQNVNHSCTGDVEFIDPAIMEVGRLPTGISNPGLDLRSSRFTSQYDSFENEARLQMLLQRSVPIPPQQNLRFNDIGNVYSHFNNDAYGVHSSSRLMEQTQTQANNLSPFSQFSLQQSRIVPMSNGHNIGMVDLVRNERLGGYNNKFYNGYEESKFHIPSSGDVYNRTFGM